MATTTSSFQPAEIISTLLTVESLLLATLSLAVALLDASRLPVNAAGAARWLLRGVTATIFVMAVGAGFGWGDEYLGDGWPSGVGRVVPVICIGVGIAIQPIIACWVTYLATRKVKVKP